MSDPNAEIDDETGDKIIGWIVTGVLMLAQWPLFAAADALGERRAAAAAEVWTNARVFWDADSRWAIPAIAAVFAPPFLLPGAFGVQWRQLVPRLEPAMRWRLVLGLVAAIGLVHGLNALTIKRELGVATDVEAVWLRDGAVVRRVTWAGAAAVEVSYEMVEGRRASNPATPTLRYDVRFADGATVPLSGSVDNDTAAWAQSLGAVDATVRAARVPREGVRDPACLAAYVEKLDGAEPGPFWAVMSD